MSTIAAISTAVGIGGIGIIRLSGKDSFEIVKKIYIPKNKKLFNQIKGYSISYGTININKQTVDEVLVSFFVAPRSYTTENMCEIQCHGGNQVMKKILEALLKNGAVLAEPGEFTKRAFMNGRIDLLQAESVIDVINAKSEREVQAGINQLEGYLSKEISDIKQEILNVMINIEVEIDYPEYEMEETTIKQIKEMLDSIKIKIEKLEKSFDNGKIIKEGIKTAIIGKPNAGKSSLLNKLLKEDRAIVTEFEGTTRDTIEEMVNINGIPLKLVDTAGIRDAKDEVERIGIKKSREMAQNADLIIAIFDGSKYLDKEDYEILSLLEGKNCIILLNKCDLVSKLNAKDKQLLKYTDKIVEISALNGFGIDILEDAITELFNLDKIKFDTEVVITNVRHKTLLSQAINNISNAEDTIIKKMPLDIIAIYIKEILENLGTISGELVSEDIIDEIFSKFCLGK